MNTKSIANLGLLKVIDEVNYNTYYGCDQAWFSTEWQRLSGCGPSVASNILFYLKHGHSIWGLEQSFNSKKNCLSLMEEVWKYVTPTREGIPTTKMFYEAMLSYAQAKKLRVKYEVIDVPKEKSIRPKLTYILKFIEKALMKDSPVAFLNLCNGDEKNLEEWHWVTIVSLEDSKDGGSVFANVLDEGIIKKINLKLWYNTTILGGGFVYFTTI